MFDDDSPPAGSQRVSESTPLAGMLSDMMLRDSVPASTSDPDYIAYYYANRTLNPRLPPPTASQSINRPLQWAGVDANSSYGRADEVTSGNNSIQLTYGLSAGCDHLVYVFRSSQQSLPLAHFCSVAFG